MRLGFSCESRLIPATWQHSIKAWLERAICLYRRAKRKAQQRAAADTVSDKDEEDVVNMRPPETESHAQTDSDIEAKLATVKDQKEAKRLKR